MSITATVENDTIKLPIHIPDGTKVEITLLEDAQAAESQAATFAERYAEFVGIWKDGPEDLATNHDQYASGAPSRGS
jgi:hypothetical protein